MSSILFVTWDGGGNVPPATALARELVRRGHEVRFLGHPSQEERLAAAGFEVVPARHVRRFVGVEPHSPLDMIATFGDRGAGRDLRDATTSRPTDLAVVDAFAFGALAAARRADVPYVVLEHAHDAYYRRTILGGPMGVSLRLRGLRPGRTLRDAALRLLLTLPELDPVPSPPANLLQVGPVAPWSPLTRTGPAVLISVSTFGYPGQAEVLQRLVDATDGTGARVVVTTGPVVDPAELRLRDDVEVHRWLPHSEVMPQMSLMVGHGGHGSTTTALAHELPLLLLPMGSLSDQPMMGRALEAAGAGIALPRDTDVTDLRAAMMTLLADGPHRAAAARLGAAIRATDAVRDGADAVESVLRDRARREPARGRPAARP